MNRRIEILTSDIERAVRDIISRGFHDPRISGLITVTAVRVLPDQSRAFIDISVLPEEKQELTFHGISSAAAFIRREAGSMVRARTLPEFVFRLDTRLKKEASIIKELEKIQQERISRGIPDEPISDSDPSPSSPSSPTIPPSSSPNPDHP